MEIKELNLEVKNIFQDIQDGEIDLKPEFQRGEVWTSGKKKLLIDTILREWHIPPIHLVELADGRSEVLDGQQRLTAVRDFLLNKITIDGSVEPYSDEISQLDKLKYRDLSAELKRRVDKYLVKVYRIKNYQSGEPNELFHRLNQTVKLTSAETRNSIFGEVRNDISSLVNHMEKEGVDKDILGFSNSRMAYNDLLSRVAILIEEGSIRYQLSESNLNSRYRNNKSFSNDILTSIELALSFFSQVKSFTKLNGIELNLTKASSLSWLYLIASSLLKGSLSSSNFDNLLTGFLHIEKVKAEIRKNEKVSESAIKFLDLPEPVIRELAFLYIERSSSRVMSIGSLLVRDLIINIAVHRSGLKIIENREYSELTRLLERLSTNPSIDVKSTLEEFSETWRVVSED